MTEKVWRGLQLITLVNSIRKLIIAYQLMFWTEIYPQPIQHAFYGNNEYYLIN